MSTVRTAFDPAQPIRVAPGGHHACRLCAGGCRSYDVLLTEREARRLDSAWWRPLLHNVPEDAPLVTTDPATQQYTLNRVEDRCVFLDADNLCIIHKAAGSDAKPLACQIFPLHAVQTPAGLNISLNVSCRRLVEMDVADPLLDPDEARRLLVQTQAIAVLGEMVTITPTLDLPYADYGTLRDQVAAILTVPAADWQQTGQQWQAAATLLLTLEGAESPADSRTLFRAAAQSAQPGVPLRSTLTALYRRSVPWLTVLSDPAAALNFRAAQAAGLPLTFFASIAGQWLAGDQIALHRTARSGWVALLAAFVGGMQQASRIVPEGGQSAAIALNEATASAVDFWLSPAGQIALTEPNQQAFLHELAALTAR